MRYHAMHSGGSLYLVSRRRWWGGAVEYRYAEWNGYTFSGGSRPDWFWMAVDGTRTQDKVWGRARRALVRAYREARNLIPAPWSSLPTARQIGS